MVQDQRRDNRIGRRRGDREIIREAVLPLDRPRATLAPGDRKDLLVAVDAHDRDVRGAAASASASVPVPAPTSTTWPCGGTSASASSHSRGRQRVSRIVSTIEASYTRVGTSRPAAGT